MADRSGDWFRQALHDLDHARSARAQGHHDWACFAAQQAAERALTRYPNGFDQGAPVDYFLDSDSREAIGHAEQVIEAVRRHLP